MSNIIYECIHCSEQMSVNKKFCRNCDTAEKRAEMDKNNKKNFEENGLIYHCDFCENASNSTKTPQ